MGKRAQPLSLVAILIRQKHSKETAIDDMEEGEDDVKSAWPLYPGLHTCYNGQDKGSQSRKTEPIPSNLASIRIEG